MGLAPYGKPRFRDRILEHLVDLKADGSFRMDMRYFNYCQGLTMTNEKFATLFGRPARKPESETDDFYKDMAASVQSVTETIILRICRFLREKTSLPRLCLGGGVALNCVANGKLLREGILDEIWIRPAAGDAGSALGGALFAWHQLLEKPREPGDRLRGSLLGPAFDCAIDAPRHHFIEEAELLACVSKLIADGQVAGWFQGPMEFGPRALGSRSILGDAHRLHAAGRLSLLPAHRDGCPRLGQLFVAKERASQDRLDSPTQCLHREFAAGLSSLQATPALNPERKMT